MIKSEEQREPVGRAGADQQPADHADHPTLDQREVGADRARQRRPGRERQRGVEDDEEGGHPTSTQTLICWSAELCGIAVQIG